MDNVFSSLSGVQETLLIPLWARAIETARSDAILRDPLAAQLVRQIDYDFSKFEARGKLLATVPCIAAVVFDRWLTAFLERCPDGAIVEIGAGLDTRFERLDNGRVRWFDVDLPEVIELRRRYFRETDRRRFVASCTTDAAWIEPVRQCGAPEVMFISQGVLFYLTEEQVRQIFTLVADHFPGSQFAGDSCQRAIRDNPQKAEGIRETGGRIQWGIDDIHEIESWDPRFRVLEVDSVVNHYRHRWDWKARLATFLIPGLRKVFTLNLLKLG